MYELWQTLRSSIASFSSFIWSWNKEQNPTAKRPRGQIIDISEDDEDDDLIILTSAKKLKLHNNRTSQGIAPCLTKNTRTQTESVEPKMSLEGQPWRFDLSSKENWEEPIEIVDLVDDTPNKFKNLYRPPRHVRSPHRIRRKTFCTKPKNEDLLISTEVAKTMSLKGQNSKPSTSRKSWPACPFSDLSQEDTFKGLPRASWSHKDGSVIAHDAYSKLLSSYIHKEPKPVVKSTVTIENVDLTNDDSGDEILTVNENKEKISAPHVKLFEDRRRNQRFGPQKPTPESRKTTFKQKVKPISAGVEFNKYRTRQIISLDDDDEDSDVQIVTSPPVPKINSLKNKIEAEAGSVVSEQWLSDLFRTYQEKKANLEEMTKMITMESKIASDIQKSSYNELTVKLLTRHLQITECFLDEEEIEEAPIPELTKEMMEVVNHAIRLHGLDSRIISKYNYTITKRDIITLTGLNWLNDEIINFYTTLIMERSKANVKLPKTHSFSTFFYLKLASGGYSGVRRWTKKVDIFEYDLIIIPVHLNVHWCLAAVDLSQKCINYYDSMGTTNDQCLTRLEEYLIEEHQDKKGTALNLDRWSKNNVKNIPQQTNGSDCGVFSCTFAEFLSRRAKFSFEQRDMPHIRQKMIYEIVSGGLIT